MLNTTYATAEARLKILELIAWSCNALSAPLLSRNLSLASGCGVHPYEDPWGKKFSKTYDKARFSKAGTAIGGNAGYRGVFEGVSADQDYLRIIFNLSRGATHQAVCHYCNMCQWVYQYQPTTPLNDLNSLFTCFGPPEERQRIWTVEEWVDLYGKTPLCTIVGFDPGRFLSASVSLKRLTLQLRSVPGLYAHRPPGRGTGLHRERFA